MNPVTSAQHHPYSASGSYRWLTCPGSITMDQWAPKEIRSEDAEQGSAAHFLASLCLTNGKHPRDYRYKGVICWELPDGFSGQTLFGGDPLPEGAVETSVWKIDADMVDHVGAYVDYVRELAKKGTLFVENQVEFGSSIGIPGAFGTADAIILSEDGTELTVVDLKYGFKEVTAENNPQLQLYALGSLNELTLAEAQEYEYGPDFEDDPEFEGWHERTGNALVDYTDLDDLI